MPLPEGFKTLPKFPWAHQIDGSTDRVVDANDSLICDNMDYESQGPDPAVQSFLALAPDHALLLAAVMANRVQFRGGSGGPIVMDVYDEDKLFPYTLDPFGCPVLSDEARAAIIKALES